MRRLSPARPITQHARRSNPIRDSAQPVKPRLPQRQPLPRTEPSKVLLGDYALQWLQRRKTTGNGLKDTTAANYVRHIRDDIIPSKLGQMKLTDIRRTHVNAFVAELIVAGRAAVTVPVKPVRVLLAASCATIRMLKGVPAVCVPIAPPPVAVTAK